MGDPGNTPSERQFASFGTVTSRQTKAVALGAAERRESGSAYQLRFRGNESIRAGAVRILSTLTDEMIGFLSDPETVGEDVAIHETRRRAKQARALLRLVGGTTGSGSKELTRAYRDAGRLLAPARDARVVVETFDELLGPSARDHPIRSHLADRAHAVEAQLFGVESSAGPDAREILEEARMRMGDIAIAEDVMSVVVGATQTYRAARKAFAHCISEPSSDAFHTWRKRVKDQRYHMAYLWDCNPVDVDVHDLQYELSDTLGEAHDLVVLAEHVVDTPSEHSDEREAIVAGAGTRRVELERAAIGYGQALYGAKPSAFALTLAERWEMWRLRP